MVWTTTLKPARVSRHGLCGEHRVRRTTFAAFLFLLVVAKDAGVTGSKSLGTTHHFQDIFLGRCYEFDLTMSDSMVPSAHQNCSDLYTSFFDAFAFKPSCGLDSQRYDEFIRMAQQRLPAGKSLFWSGTYGIVHRLSAGGSKFVTLEDTLIGFLMDRLQWCGDVNLGVNYDVCPAWDGCKGHSAGSFWEASSQWFAKSASGEAYVLLKGTDPNRKAYKRDSFFASSEVANMNSSKVTRLNVILMQELGKTKRETCSSGSLLDLRDDVTSKGIEFTCQENPPDLLHLMCADDPSHDECQVGNGADGHDVETRLLPLFASIALLFFYLPCLPL